MRIDTLQRYIPDELKYFLIRKPIKEIENVLQHRDYSIYLYIYISQK